MPIEPLPTSDSGAPREPRPVADGLDRLLRGLGAPRSSTVTGLHAHWPTLVGAAMAAHARPVRVRDGVLVIAVDDPLWASEVRWLGDDLAAKVRDLLNDDSVKRIEVRVVGSEGPRSGDGGSARGA